jgi:hypothetical protein
MAAAMPPVGFSLPLEPQIAAQLDCINFFNGGWNDAGRNALITSFVQQHNIPNRHAFNALFQQHIPVDRQARWVPSLFYPMPALPNPGVIGNGNKIAQVQSDEEQIVRMYNDNNLRFLIKFPRGHPKIPKQFRDGSGELLITVPLSSGTAYAIHCVEFMLTIPLVKYSYPAIHYL